MKLTINARNMSVTPGITQRIEKKTHTMSRYLLPETEMQVRMRKEKNDNRVVEITVPMGNNVILRSEAADQNLFVAIDQALAKMERQIRKHRTKLAKRLREDAFTEVVPEYYEEEQEEINVVRSKKFQLEPMGEEEAIMQMEMLNHDFFVYLNMETDSVNVVYKRKDGNYGVLETTY